MNISSTFVCIQCEGLAENPRVCEYCCSNQIWPLKAWLNRDLQTDSAEVKQLERLIKL